MIHNITAGRTAANMRTGSRGRAVFTGGAGTAARVADLLSGIMAWALEEELIDRNPVHGVKRYRGEARDRFLSAEEIARLGTALRSGRDAEGKPVNPFALAILSLLLLTGCRGEGDRGPALVGRRWTWSSAACAWTTASPTGA
jgi:integrase